MCKKMRIIILLLSMMPIIVVSQHGGDKDPLTSFANVVFQEGKIVYIVGQKQAIINPKLVPRVYYKEVLQLRFNGEFDGISADYIAESQKQIIDYLTDLGIRNKYYIVVGGAPISPEWAQEIGADGYARTAVGAAQLVKKLFADNAPPPIPQTIILNK